MSQIASILVDSQDVDKADLRAYLAHREIVNVKDHGAVGDGSTDDAAAFQAALDTGDDVFVPVGSYAIASTIYMVTEGQRFFGAGSYGAGATTLKWTGTSGRFIEMRSGREQSGNVSDSVSNMQLFDFKIESATGSVLTNALWLEAGTFHCQIERLYFRNLTGRPTEAIIKLDAGSNASYPVNPTFRDIVIRGGLNDDEVAVPRGIWIEACIEGYFDHVHVYDCSACWAIGTDDTDRASTVSDNCYVACQGEIGDRGYVADVGTNGDGGRALQYYQGLNESWVSSKFLSGVSFASATDQQTVIFSTLANSVCRSIKFAGCTFNGQRRSNYGIVFDSTANYVGLTIRDAYVTGYVSEFIHCNSDVDPLAEVTGDTYANYGPVRATFRCQGETYDPGSLTDGSGETATLSEVTIIGSDPVLCSFSNDLQGILLTAYRNSAGNTARLRFQNETGGTVDLTSGKLRIRHIHPDEVFKAASVETVFDPPTLADGAGTTTTISMPGAAMGDLVAVGFLSSDTGNLGGIMLTGYVSAANTVSARFQNETGGSKNLSSGTLTAYLLHRFDRMGSATYDPASLADGAGVTTTVTVTGAALGDFAVASFSNDLQGIIVTAYVSSANTVSVRFQNETGGTIDLASGTLTCGVYKRYSSM